MSEMMAEYAQRKAEKDARAAATPTRIDVVRAIARIEESRDSHVKWVAYFEKWPETEAKYDETVGSREHNLRVIAEYDHVLDVLRRVLLGVAE